MPIANVNYAAEYSRALAQQYPYLSYFAALLAANNSNKYKSGMGKTMYIPTITVNGARAVNRNSIDGNFSRNWENQWQAVELQMDREWDTLVDPMDIDETAGVAAIANITRAFVEQQKVPEMDAFIASKLASFASGFGGVSTQSLTSATILTEWDNGLAYMTNQRVNRDRVVAYMTPATYKLLKQATGMTRFIEVTSGIRDVDRNIARLDGVTVIEVPEDMMKTVYDFTTGWAVEVQKMVDNGITGYVDAGNHHWSPEAYVTMDIRTTLANTAREAVFEQMDAYGDDLFVVSWHDGARPLCYPWQGKVIARAGPHGSTTDLDGNTVEVFALSETSYGEPAGLFGRQFMPN